MATIVICQCQISINPLSTCLSQAEQRSFLCQTGLTSHDSRRCYAAEADLPPHYKVIASPDPFKVISYMVGLVHELVISDIESIMVEVFFYII